MDHLGKKAFVLLSGGIDSTTCLALAIEHMKQVNGVVETYSMDYGQRHIKEAECAQQIADYYKVKHTVIDVRGALGLDSMLTDASQEVPNISYAEIKGVSPTYVPFRNGFMLSRLAAEAQRYANKVHKYLDKQSSMGGHWSPVPDKDFEDIVTIYFGAHAEDAQNWAYPDCTPEFVGAMANAIYIGTYRAVRLVTPFNYASKTDIVRKGFSLQVPYELTWSCYKGEEQHCGVCPTCRARKQAFIDADLSGEMLHDGVSLCDPTKYAA